MQCHPVDNFRYLSFSHYPLSPPASQLSYWQFSLFTHQLHYVTPHSLTNYSVRSFFQLVGDLSELNEKHYDDLNQHQNTKTFPMRESQAPPSLDCLEIELDDLEVISTLGVGGFGRVELVKVKLEMTDQVCLRLQLSTGWNQMDAYICTVIHVCLEHNYISCILFIHIFMLFIHVWLNVYGPEWFQLHFTFFAK